MRRAVLDAVDHHPARACQRAAAAHQIDFAAGEVAFIDAIEAQHVGIAALLQRGPVMARQAEIEAVFGSIVRSVGDLRRIPHDFLGHAAHVDAGAAEARGLDDQGARAVLRGTLGAGEPAAAAAHDDQVVSLH